ncbi:hypothetical protein [Streptomyces sp. A1136]|uniref:hypothetical protein n=1 Tax=Streptomyces sp. A1136 TaxID=2563102 RepID=UPI00109E8104|nr:hypothetical protein [Streptomyces sp. A1136]THA49995.1 hypothetical protein E6R62_26660 [Streptomyces sp. A1136]
MCQTAVKEAEREGKEFARAMKWLGSGEQEEIASLFAQHHLRLRKEALRAIIERGEELQTRYSRRYADFRTRLIGICIGACAIGFTAAVLLTLL